MLLEKKKTKTWHHLVSLANHCPCRDPFENRSTHCHNYIVNALLAKKPWKTAHETDERVSVSRQQNGHQSVMDREVRQSWQDANVWQSCHSLLSASLLLNTMLRKGRLTPSRRVKVSNSSNSTTSHQRIFHHIKWGGLNYDGLLQDSNCMIQNYHCNPPLQLKWHFILETQITLWCLW